MKIKLSRQILNSSDSHISIEAGKFEEETGGRKEMISLQVFILCNKWDNLKSNL